MLSFDEYVRRDGLGLAELVARKEVTSAELVETAIRRIEQVNPTLNAVVHPMFDYARAQGARAAVTGPFAGVPFVLKDLLSALEGFPMTSGSRFYAGWCPDYNSALVDRYLASGAVVLGKTNSPELGLLPTTEPEAYGPSRNPWDPERTTGGSSGGSAAAVASGMVPLGGGGDGGGSIRIPCSCCGLFGLKPSRGRTPTGPRAAEDWHGFAQEHVLTRSVRDSAAMLDAVCGHYPGDAHYLPRPPTPFLEAVGRAPGALRIACSAEPFVPAKVDREVERGLQETADLLRDLGHEVVEDAPRLDGATFARAYLVVIGAQTWATIREAEAAVGRKARRRDFENKTWLAGLLGEAFTAGEYVAAVRTLQAITRPVHDFLERYDVVLNPTLSQPPPRLGFLQKSGVFGHLERLVGHLAPRGVLRADKMLDEASAESFAFVPYTPLFNVTGQPSMSVPLCWSEAGLPMGMMFSARLGAEATLLSLAAQLEEARPWRDRRPAI